MATQAFDKIESFRFTPKDHFTDEAFMKKVAKDVDKGLDRTEIQDKHGINPFAVRAIPVVLEEGQINFRNETELGKAVVRERNKGQAWALIGARLGGMSEATVQRIYENTTGEPYHASDIGKGGRPLTGEGRAPRKTAAKAAKKTAKKTAAKATGKKTAAKKTAKATGKKTAAKKTAKKTRARKPNFGDEPTVESVAGQLDGKTVTIAKGDAELTYEVVEVQAVKQAKSGRWGAKVTVADGGEKTFALDTVVKVG